MVAPGKRFYATRLPALSFGECRRMTGGAVIGTIVWLITRFKGAEGRMLLPQLQADVRADRDELSEAARGALYGAEQELAALGYQAVLYQRIRTPTDETQKDSGGVVALSADGLRLALINFIRQEKPVEGVVDTVTFSFVSFRGGSGSISVTNFGKGLDHRPDCRAEFLKSTDLTALEQRLLKLCAREKDSPLVLRSAEEVAAALDREDFATFEDRVERRRLFVPVE